MMKEKATQDKEKIKAQDEMKKIDKKRKDFEKENVDFQKKMNELKEKISLDENKMEKERKEFAKKFSEFYIKTFEEKKIVELKCVKLSQQVFEFEKVIILERDKFEKENKKIKQTKNVKKYFDEEKKVFEIEIKKLNEKLFELSTNIQKEKNAKSELHKKFDILSKERNCLSTKIKELQRLKNLRRSCSSNPLFDANDNHTSKLNDKIRPSNLFYDKNVNDLGNIKKDKSQKKTFWRRKDEKEKWIWKVKGSSEEKKEQKSFVHTLNAKSNNAHKGKTFGKPDLVYTINQLIRTRTSEKEQWLLDKTVQDSFLNVSELWLLVTSDQNPVFIGKNEYYYSHWRISNNGF
ncbi:hypothetical protein L6452_02392 [Arctium lappa]|uniref:Uncharacterized protein n=1 Tax=Arctium lappa TaxID=4217 RepID=A0ACB9FJG9_ARCLA|nr:hypothetical protein L6452_02392 [Arctium lappa]